MALKGFCTTKYIGRGFCVLSGQSRGYRERAICFASGILRWSSAIRLESLGCVLRKSELEAEAGADPEERDAIFCQKAVAALES